MDKLMESNSPSESLTTAENNLKMGNMEKLSSLNNRFRHYLLKVKKLDEINSDLSIKVMLSRNSEYGDVNSIADEMHRNLQSLHSAFIEEHSKLLLAQSKLDYNLKLKDQLEKECIEAGNENLLRNRQKMDLVASNEKITAEILSNNIKVNQLKEDNDCKRKLLTQLENQRKELEDKLQDVIIENQKLRKFINLHNSQIVLRKTALDEVVLKCSLDISEKVDDETLFYRSELEKCKKELKVEFESKAKELLNGIENKYKAELFELKQSLEKRQLATPDHIVSTATDEDLLELKKLQEEIKRCKEENVKLNADLKSLDYLFEKQSIDNKEMLHSKTSLIDSTQLRIMELSSKLRTADCSNIDLIMELDTYSKLLDHEEKFIDKNEISNSDHLDQSQNLIVVDNDDDKISIGNQDTSVNSKESHLSSSEEDVKTADAMSGSELSFVRFDQATKSIDTVDMNKNETISQNFEVKLKCRCGRVEIHPNEKVLQADVSYIKCVDCLKWSHAACYKIVNLRDRKRRNFYCQRCYSDLKKRRT